MKKRILSWILSIALVVTFFPVFASAEQTASMHLSDAGVEMIKSFEGFISTPMPDGSQWAIGYGSKCEPGLYPNGITEEQAEILLQESVAYFEDSLNGYLNVYGISLEQHQFDALLSITYNLGVAWINSSYRFWTMLRNGLENYTDNQIASAIGVWCHVGTAVNDGILERRIEEIQLFLYGDYPGESSIDFRHLIFDGNGGEVDTDIMLYRANEPYGEFTSASREGYYFTGWYTAPDGGTQVLESDLASADDTLYAHWSSTPVTEQPVTPEPTSDYFTDVQDTDWFFEYVEEMAAEGAISGYPDNTYRPNASVTVGQSLKLVLLAAGCETQSPTTSHWASGYQQLALDLGIVTQEQVANLDAPASRLLVAQITAGALGLQPAASQGEYADTDDGYAVALYYAGIMEGSTDSAGNRNFRPTESVKRSEIAKIIWSMGNL